MFEAEGAELLLHSKTLVGPPENGPRKPVGLASDHKGLLYVADGDSIDLLVWDEALGFRKAAAGGAGR